MDHKMAKAKRIKDDRERLEYEIEPASIKGANLDQIETAAYISDVVLQLRNMAKAADLKFLVYFLEMAFQEAFSQSTRNQGKDNS